MKKISLFFGIIGLILLTFSVIFIVNSSKSSNNNKNDNNNDSNNLDDEIIIPWTNEYQNGENEAKNLKKYEPSSYKKITINQDNSFYHIIPKDVYLCRIGNNDIEYCNKKISVLRYTEIVDYDRISSIINSGKSSGNYIEFLKYELENENIILLEKRIDGNHYSEKLHLFIKSFFKHYYYMYYYVDNMNFSNAFINEIINMNKYKDNNKYVNQDGKWVLSLGIKNKNKFELRYDTSKYLKTDYYQDYVFTLRTDENSSETINIYFYYDNLGVNENTNTTFTIKNSEKMKLKNYDVWLYKTVNSKNIEYIDYIIMLDKYSKLRINYPKSLENQVDINDFLNFIYK